MMRRTISLAIGLVCSLGFAEVSSARAQEATTLEQKPSRDEPAATPKKPSLSKANFLITGLHCPPCTSTVEGSLRKVKGVQSIKVDWNTKNAVVEFDESIIPVQKVSKLIAATPHMMGNDMKYSGWLALKVAGVDQEATAAKAKDVLAKVKGVAKVAVYPKQGSVGVAFTEDGKVTVQELLSALEAAGLKGSSFAESAVKTSFRSADANVHDGMAMDSAVGHADMRGNMSCPACQGMAGMKGMTGGQRQAAMPMPIPKVMRATSYIAQRGCGC